MVQSNWSEDAPYCVYKHTSPSGKVYVGQTRQKILNKRWRNGNIYGYCHMSIFRKAIDKYGWDNFTHEIIKDGLTKIEADECEKYWIKYYKELNISYNVSNGGDGCSRKMSEETKKKISEAHKGKKRGPHSKEWNENISKHRKGISNPPEAIQRAAEKRRGKPHSKESLEKISRSVSGRIHINNGHQNKFIRREELEHYLENGWRRGRLKLKYKIPNTPSLIRKGKIIVNNGELSKFIKEDELDHYLENGWTRGKAKYEIKNPDVYKHMLGKKRIYLGDNTKFVREDELEYYLQNGWRLYKKTPA